MATVTAVKSPCRVTAFLLLAGCQAVPPPAVEPVSPDISFEERLLARIPEEWAAGVSDAWNSFLSSPDGRSAAYVVYLPYQGPDDAICFLVHGDRKGPVVKSVGATAMVDSHGIPVFSPDGRRLAYAARLGSHDKGPWCVVIDGVQDPPWPDASDPIFSPDGRRPCRSDSPCRRRSVPVPGRHRGPAGVQASAGTAPSGAHEPASCQVTKVCRQDPRHFPHRTRRLDDDRGPSRE